jgi:hypothetical protein
MGDREVCQASVEMDIADFSCTIGNRMGGRPPSDPRVGSKRRMAIT